MFVSKDENNSKSVLKQILNITIKRLADETLPHSDSESTVSECTSSSRCVEEFVDTIIEEVANEIIEKQNLSPEGILTTLESASCTNITNASNAITQNTTTALDQNDSTKLDDWDIPMETSQIQNDILFILHSLCKMSMKTISNK